VEKYNLKAANGPLLGQFIDLQVMSEDSTSCIGSGSAERPQIVFEPKEVG
jgi:hypothetical protein